MFELRRLLDLSESYATYLVLGAAAAIVGLVVANLGGWFAPGAMSAIGNLLLSPGRALVVGAFIAAGVAGHALPTGTRIASLAVGAFLFLHVVGGFGVMRHLL